MFKMGCSMARKILAPGSGGGSSASASGGQVSAPGDGGADQHQHHHQSGNNKKQQQHQQDSGGGPMPKPKTGDELNDFSKLEEDPRLPLNVRQIFKITKSWKAIARTMSKTGTAMFLNLFEQNQDLFYLFDRFQHLKGKQELHESMELREHAATVMSTLDQSINLLSDYDNFVAYLHSIGKLHRKVPGFQREHFWKIEQPFLKAIKQTLDERCNETIEEIYKIAIKLIIETIADGYGQDDNDQQQQHPAAPSDSQGDGGGSSPDGGNGGQRRNNHGGANRDPNAGGKTGQQQTGFGGAPKSSGQAVGEASGEVELVGGQTMEASGEINQTTLVAGEITARSMASRGVVEEAKRRLNNWMPNSTAPSNCSSSCCPLQSGLQSTTKDELELGQQMNQLASGATLNVKTLAVLQETNRMNDDCYESSGYNNKPTVGDDDNKIGSNIDADAVASNREETQAALLIGSACNLINRMTTFIELDEQRTLIENDCISRESSDATRCLMRDTLLVALDESTRGIMRPKGSDRLRKHDDSAAATTTTLAQTKTAIGLNNIGDSSCSRLPSRVVEPVLCSMRKGEESCAIEPVLLATLNAVIKNSRRSGELPDKRESASKEQQDSQMKIINSRENFENNCNNNNKICDHFDGGERDSSVNSYHHNEMKTSRSIEENFPNNNQVNKQVHAKNIINHNLSRNAAEGTCMAHMEVDQVMGPTMKQESNHFENISQDPRRSVDYKALSTLISQQEEEEEKQLHRPPICAASSSYIGEFHLLQAKGFNDQADHLDTGSSMKCRANGMGMEATIEDSEQQIDKVVVVLQSHVEASKFIDFRDKTASWHEATFNNNNTAINNDGRSLVLASKLFEAGDLDPKGNPLSSCGLQMIETLRGRELQTTTIESINTPPNRTKIKLMSSLNSKRNSRQNLDNRDPMNYEQGSSVAELEPINGSIRSTSEIGDKSQADLLTKPSRLYTLDVDGDNRSYHQLKQRSNPSYNRLANLSEAFEQSRLVADKLLFSSTETNLSDMSESIKMLILINRLILSLASSRTLSSTTTPAMDLEIKT